MVPKKIKRSAQGWLNEIPLTLKKNSTWYLLTAACPDPSVNKSSKGKTIGCMMYGIVRSNTKISKYKSLYHKYRPNVTTAVSESAFIPSHYLMANSSMGIKKKSKFGINTGQHM